MPERPLLKGLVLPDANCCPSEAAIWFGARQHQLAASLMGMDGVRCDAEHSANGDASVPVSKRPLWRRPSRRPYDVRH